MKTFVRLLLTGVSGVSAFYFVFWAGAAALSVFARDQALWGSFAFALLAAFATARYVWARTTSVQRGFASSMALGALLTGGVGFAGGFFGPMIFAPDANQGPLLGIFITGPLGVLVGALGGAVYWLGWIRPHTHRAD